MTARGAAIYGLQTMRNLILSFAVILAPHAALAQIDRCGTVPGAGAYQLDLARPPSVVRIADNAAIPPDPANRDWACYQAWLTAGNTPLPAPVPPPQTTISANQFFGRFTAAEKQAIWSAAAADQTGRIGSGLTHGLAAGSVSLTDPVLKQWLDALVASGAMTGERETAVLTP
jgi:hypothetical protein